MGGLYSYVFTSSMLILAFVALRALFFRKISMRLQYGLWLLIAVKLLAVPVPWLESSLSVERLLEPCENMLHRKMYGTQPGSDSYAGGRRAGDSKGQQAAAGHVQEQAEAAQDPHKAKAAQKTAEDQQAGRFDIRTYLVQREGQITGLLARVAGTGTVILFLYFLAGNLRFAAYLKKIRIRWPDKSCPLPVYLADGLPSPCLFGRAVYITPELASDEQRLFYVLLHEYCHYRQGDMIWSLLRCLCLVSCWWNPLVWLAAYLSKQDCELACDEAVMAYLGKEEKLSYGRTLLSIVPVKENTKGGFFIATALMGGGNHMKRRIERIAHNQKSMLSVCMLAVFLAGMCFISASTAKPASRLEQAGLAEAAVEDSQNTLPSGKAGGQDALLAASSQAEPSAGNRKDMNPDKLNTDTADGKSAVRNLDEAAGQAVLFYNKERYCGGECVAEGHIRLEEEKDENGRVTVYALTMYGEYEFHDGYFIKGSGTGAIPAVMEFSYDENRGYELEEYRQPEDGGYYVESIHEMFPEHLWEACVSVSDADIAELEKQEQACAKRYLKKIGRKASVGDYADLEHPLLTDAGVSVKVSNSLCEYDKRYLSKYPDWIGNLERIEDGVRYVYEMALDKKAGEIVYTKSVYDTGEEVERYRMDMYTGEEL